ncbi:AMP-binding protein, partial [Streptosporangium algeriense]
MIPISAGNEETAPGLLTWLNETRADRGIHVLTDDGRWRFQPYTELADGALRAAHRLRSLGARPGDTVAIIADDPREFVTAFMGTMAAGSVPLPIAGPRGFRRAGHFSRHLASVLSVAGPVLVCGDETAREPVARATGNDVPFAGVLDPGGTGRPEDLPTPRRGPADLAFVQFTSGSSASPKGVRITRANLSANIASIRGWLRWSEQDVFASWLPLYHDMGLVGAMITSVVSGTDLWLMTPRQFVREPVRWLECFGLRGATLTTAPTFGYAHVARRVDPARL